MGTARHGKPGPGRKTAGNAAQGLQPLPQEGFVRGSLPPAPAWSALRASLRHREGWLDYAAAHIPHMQNALRPMHLQRHPGVSDRTGVTGLRSLRASGAGHQHPAALAASREGRCTAAVDPGREAWEGQSRRAHGGARQQALELDASSQAQSEACDTESEATRAALEHAREGSFAALPAARDKPCHATAPKVPVRDAVCRVRGGALSPREGLRAETALQRVGDCGPAMTKWPTAPPVTSWRTLAPGHTMSGGQVLRATTRRAANRAAKIFRFSAVTVGRTQTERGACARRRAARIGQATAVTATARQWAGLFSHPRR